MTRSAVRRRCRATRWWSGASLKRLAFSPASALCPRFAVVRDGSGGYLLGFNGVPTVTYRMQRAPSVAGPWSDLVTNTAPASGLIEYHETSPPPGAAFYRTAQP
jgi:hypothetical protein